MSNKCKCGHEQELHYPEPEHECRYCGCFEFTPADDPAPDEKSAIKAMAVLVAKYGHPRNGRFVNWQARPEEIALEMADFASQVTADDPASDMVEKANDFGLELFGLSAPLDTFQSRARDFAASVHADLIRENRELKEKVEYFGKLADEMTALAKRNRQLEAKILVARKQLKSDHIQDNKDRLGLLGSQDIDRVYAALEDK